MRVRLAGLSLLVLLACLLVAPNAGAAGPKRTAVQCNLKVNVTFTPGISLTATTVTFSGIGGSISGSYGPDTCASGKGKGTFNASIGGKAVKGSFTYTRVATAGTFTGTATNGLGSTATLAGGFLFQPPTNQNCATVRVTKATVTGSAALEG